MGNPEELRRGTQLLPQNSRAGISISRFRRRLTFELDPENETGG